MQIVSKGGDNLHEISYPVLGKNNEIFQNAFGWKIYPECQALNEWNNIVSTASSVSIVWCTNYFFVCFLLSNILISGF